MHISADAVSGLLGVVLGSATTGGFQLHLARRAEHARSRAARLLVGAELRAIREALDFAGGGDAGDWHDVLPDIQRVRWDQFSEQLTNVVSDKAWMALSDAYLAVDVIVRCAKVEDFPERDQCDNAIGQIAAGLRALAASTPRSLSRRGRAAGSGG